MTNLGSLMNGEIVAAWDENGEDVRFCSLDELVTFLSFPNFSAIGSDKLTNLASTAGPPLGLVSMHHCLAGAQEVQAHILHIDGQRAKICIPYDNSSPPPILLLKLCKPGRAAWWGTEIPLEVEMHAPCVLN